MVITDVTGLNNRDVVATAQRKVNAALLDYCAAFSSRKEITSLTSSSEHTQCATLATLDIGDQLDNGTDKFGDLLIQVRVLHDCYISLLLINNIRIISRYKTVFVKINL